MSGSFNSLRAPLVPLSGKSGFSESVSDSTFNDLRGTTADTDDGRPTQTFSIDIYYFIMNVNVMLQVKLY